MRVGTCFPSRLGWISPYHSTRVTYHGSFILMLGPMEAHGISLLQYISKNPLCCKDSTHLDRVLDLSGYFEVQVMKYNSNKLKIRKFVSFHSWKSRLGVWAEGKVWSGLHVYFCIILLSLCITYLGLVTLIFKVAASRCRSTCFLVHVLRERELNNKATPDQ